MNCPGCGAAMAMAGNRRHLHCAHCNHFHFPEKTGDGISPLGEPAGCDCPVCHRPLQNALIDSESAAFCDRCRGFLAVTWKFAQIVKTRRAHHRPHERIDDPFDPAELKRVLQCPSCRQRMDTQPYCGGGKAVVDTCERCGLIWLDAGELAIIERHSSTVSQIDQIMLIAQQQPRERDAYDPWDGAIEMLRELPWLLG